MANPTLIQSVKKATGLDDPLVDKHAGELFGTPSGPDFTPVDERYVPPGRVLVEWVGDSGPMAVRKLEAAVNLRLIPKQIVDAWMTLSERIITAIPGLSHHTMSRERDNMSETITWGPHPGTYVQAVTYKDADTLLSGTFAHQFRVVGYKGEQPADWDPYKRFLEPYVDSATLAKVHSIVINEGPPERLVGIATTTGGKRLGSWT